MLMKWSYEPVVHSSGLILNKWVSALKKDRSFSSYVFHRFYNELFDAVRNYLNRNTSSISTK